MFSYRRVYMIWSLSVSMSKIQYHPLQVQTAYYDVHQEDFRQFKTGILSTRYISNKYLFTALRSWLLGPVWILTVVCYFGKWPNFIALVMLLLSLGDRGANHHIVEKLSSSTLARFCSVLTEIQLNLDLLVLIITKNFLYQAPLSTVTKWCAKQKWIRQ